MSTLIDVYYVYDCQRLNIGPSDAVCPKCFAGPFWIAEEEDGIHCNSCYYEGTKREFGMKIEEKKIYTVMDLIADGFGSHLG